MTKETINGWNSPVTAQAYHEYTLDFPMYPKSSQDLVDMAELQSGDVVVDLGCGTGITSQQICQAIGPNGRIIAVDQSTSMINLARANQNGAGVTFIQSPAENLHLHLSEPVDAVICNAAIWEMNLENTFKTVGKILKPGGKFAFSIPGQFYRFPAEESRVKSREQFFITLPLLMFSIARASHGLTEMGFTVKDLISDKDIPNFAHNSGLTVKSKTVETYPRTAEDAYRFETIPVMTERLLPGLDYPTRMAILETAYRRLDKTKINPSRWVFYLTVKE